MNQRDDQLSPIDGAVTVTPSGHVARVLPPELPPSSDIPPPFTDEEKLAMLAQADQQRAQLSQRSLNLDHTDRPHFLRIVGGVETCGQDGQPWPCSAWRLMESQQRTEQLTPAGNPPAQGNIPPTLQQVVDQIGAHKVREFLDNLPDGER